MWDVDITPNADAFVAPSTDLPRFLKVDREDDISVLADGYACQRVYEIDRNVLTLQTCALAD